MLDLDEIGVLLDNLIKNKVALKDRAISKEEYEDIKHVLLAKIVESPRKQKEALE